MESNYVYKHLLQRT